MQSINPATGQIIQSFAIWHTEEIDAALKQVESAQTEWAALSFAQRSCLMHNLAQILRQRSEEYANLITEEMGKLLKEARAEIVSITPIKLNSICAMKSLPPMPAAVW